MANFHESPCAPKVCAIDMRLYGLAFLFLAVTIQIGVRRKIALACLAVILRAPARILPIFDRLLAVAVVALHPFEFIHSHIIGFGCYDATWKNAFGPTGVHESARGRGAGQALLLVCLAAMKADGYAYAVIAGVGPAEFYRKCVGAEIIPGSSPGFYPPFLKSET